jgi:hypothetical protein
MKARAAALDLRVRLLGDPCLWCWEIVDLRRGGAVVRSSWTGDWAAYESFEEARIAGGVRLGELRSAGAGRGRDGDRRKGGRAA